MKRLDVRSSLTIRLGEPQFVQNGMQRNMVSGRRDDVDLAGVFNPVLKCGRGHDSAPHIAYLSIRVRSCHHPNNSIDADRKIHWMLARIMTADEPSEVAWKVWIV